MPFRDECDLTFNCGFCCTAIYECLPKKTRKSSKKPTEERHSGQSTEASQSGEVARETPGNTEVCAPPDVAERFKALFGGPQFTVGDSYFARVSSSTQSLFGLHVKKVKAACINGFRSASDRDRYVTAFSSANWVALSESEKAGHSLSNCVPCATQFEQLQKMFPLKPIFLCPSEDENASVCIDRVDEVCRQGTGKPFAELSANLGYKSPTEVEQIVKQAEKKCIRETQRQCVAEGKKQLENSALQAAFATDTRFLKYDKMRRAQYLVSPSEAHESKKKRYPLRPGDCDRFDELRQTLINWNPAKTLVASELAKEFNIMGTDSSHRIKLLACELNPSIPGSEVLPKPKSSRRKLGDSSLSLPIPPNKKRLLEDSALYGGQWCPDRRCAMYPCETESLSKW